MENDSYEEFKKSVKKFMMVFLRIYQKNNIKKQWKMQKKQQFLKKK